LRIRFWHVLGGINPRGRCVLTSSQQAWNHAIPKDRVQHAYWLMKTQDRQSLVCQPFYGPARKDSAVRVSLSSYHNVKEPPGMWPVATSRTPDGSKSPIRSQRQPQRLPRWTQVVLRFCPRIARSRTVPQEVGTTRANGLFKQRTPPCQGLGNSWAPFRFSFWLWPWGHIPARMRRHSRFVNGEVTIRG